MAGISKKQLVGLGLLMLVFQLMISRSHISPSVLVRYDDQKPFLDNIAFPPDTSGTVGRWLWAWQPDIQLEFQQLVDENVEQDDPRLVNFIRKIIIAPSQHRVAKSSGKVVHTKQSAAVLELLNNKKNGFFIECGAFDGEHASNTFYLERNLGWTGLLIEMDPYYFLQLLGKNRSTNTWNNLPEDVVNAPTVDTFKQG